MSGALERVPNQFVPPVPMHGESVGARPLTPVEADILAMFINVNAPLFHSFLKQYWEVPQDRMPEVIATMRAKLHAITAQALRVYP